MNTKRLATLLGLFAVAALFTAGAFAQSKVTLLNVSYDPTRELYAALNKAFAPYYKQKTGIDVTINQSHGGSGAQANAVIGGLEADLVTLALASDIDAIAKKTKALDAEWQKKLPLNSTPYTSTIIFIVRKGNPKAIKDWDDVVKPGIGVITPNPKTSGGARWAYLAAWGYALKKFGTEAKAKDFVKALYKNVPVLDTGARGSTLTFAQRSIGDVALAWENEAYLVLDEFGKDKFEIIVPSSSILAEPPVAAVDKVVQKRGTAKVVNDYLNWLYTPEAQEIIAKNHYRATDPNVAKKYAASFPKLNLFTIQEVAGGWAKAQPQHFGDGGIFDQIYEK